jgi:hypothetical protein
MSILCILVRRIYRAGFWLWQVKSMDEAVEWVKRLPMPAGLPADAEGEIEIRPVFEMEDLQRR